MDDDPLSDLIRNHATRHRVGERLRADIRARIALEAAARAPDGDAATPPARQAARSARDTTDVRPRWWRFGLGGALAGFAAGVAVTLVLVPALRPGPSGPATALASAGTPLNAELVASHVRSLAEGPLIQVASTDRHTVKPWFQGKLDYAPPVFNLESEGYPLVGGRVDRVRGQATAVLVFEHRRHMLNLFVSPSDQVEAEARQQQRGFNIVHWSDGTMQYWAVSDMDATEISHFGEAWRKQN